MPRVPEQRGPFGPDEARRLLWRAGFGPRPGEAERLAGLGLDRAVDSLVHPRWSGAPNSTLFPVTAPNVHFGAARSRNFTS